ncbi:condensation domain-containing protein, partial [Pseudoalteromonas sp. PS5]
MNIVQLIHQANSSGVTLFCKSGKLGFRLNKGCTFPPELKQSIADNKQAIIEFLTAYESSPSLALKPITPVDRNTDKFPLSFAQQRLWFIDSLQGSTPEYNMPMVFELSGTISLTSIQRAFREIIARHEVLRTVYEEHDG